MTLFLIGNGFDLNCGMNTRFSDVYKEYVNSDSKSPIIESFKREIFRRFRLITQRSLIMLWRKRLINIHIGHLR